MRTATRLGEILSTPAISLYDRPWYMLSTRQVRRSGGTWARACRMASLSAWRAAGSDWGAGGSISTLNGTQVMRLRLLSESSAALEAMRYSQGEICSDSSELGRAL